MELNYIKEHTSCLNYKTEEYSGFSLGQALTGENFDNQEQEIKANHLIFILSGEVEITKDENEKARVHANEFVFIPISSHYVGKVILPGRYINLTFFPYALHKASTIFIISNQADLFCCTIIFWPKIT